MRECEGTQCSLFTSIVIWDTSELSNARERKINERPSALPKERERRIKSRYRPPISNPQGCVTKQMQVM